MDMPVKIAVEEGKVSLIQGTRSEVEQINENNMQAELTVMDSAGAELPNTGGPGITLLAVLGSILVVGTGVLLIRRRRTA